MIRAPHCVVNKDGWLKFWPHPHLHKNIQKGFFTRPTRRGLISRKHVCLLLSISFISFKKEEKRRELSEDSWNLGGPHSIWRKLSPGFLSEGFHLWFPLPPSKHPSLRISSYFIEWKQTNNNPHPEMFSQTQDGKLARKCCSSGSSYLLHTFFSLPFFLLQLFGWSTLILFI